MRCRFSYFLYDVRTRRWPVRCGINDMRSEILPIQGEERVMDAEGTDGEPVTEVITILTHSAIDPVPSPIPFYQTARTLTSPCSLTYST